ncbi:MAG TPA: flagellar basal body-associated FliL family protein [bacterium]|nr:flagellar basal body-associated FliL family protein [bacterium]
MAVDEEAPEGGGGEKKEKPAGGSNPLVKILIGAAVAIAIVTIAVVVSYKAAGDVKNPTEPVVKNTGDDEPTAVKSPCLTVEVGEIITVIRGNSLKMKVTLAYDGEAEQNKKMGEELEKRLPQLRAQYLQFLFSRSDAELAPANIGTLKDNMLVETNKVFSEGGQLADVYITEYVFTGK